METLEDRTVPTTFAVTLATDTGATDSLVTPLGPGTPGDLRNAIFQADQAPDQANVIDLSGISGTVRPEAMLPPIFTTGGGSLTVTGPGAANLSISGERAVRPFFILEGDVSISGVTIANRLAHVGNGGAGGKGDGSIHSGLIVSAGGGFLGNGGLAGGGGFTGAGADFNGNGTDVWWGRGAVEHVCGSRGDRQYWWRQ